ncbi:MAG: VCBS repeat-containing protein, partial [Bacteroidota bacterium]
MIRNWIFRRLSWSSSEKDVKVSKRQRLCSIFFMALVCSSPLLAQEVCNNGFDDDADGLVDCFDDECIANAACTDFFFGNTSALPAPSASPNFSLNLKWGSPDQTANSHATAAVGDIDQDGNPEVIVTNKQTQTVYVLNGEDGSVQWQENMAFDPENAVAIGDINDDDCAEIFVSEDGGTGNIVAYDCNGVQVWSQNLGERLGMLGLADFDGDGIVELYTGDYILNAVTGNVVVAGSGNQAMDWTFGSLAVDILPDGACPSCAGLELITGNEIWAVDILGNSKSIERDMDAPLADNYHPKFITATADNKSSVSVADYNLDGFLDVILPGAQGGDFSGPTTLFFWDVQNDVVTTYHDPTNNHIRGMGRVSIGDVDGDGQMNACYVSDQRLYCLDESFNPLWTKNIADGASGYSGNTLFDFDDDQVMEILYRSEGELMIIDGADGTTRMNVPCVSRQQGSYPLVADVDADGISEICVTCYTDNATPYNPYANTQFSQVRVYEPATDIWLPSRSVWNQHGYHNVNVNDDLTIPREQQDHSATIGLDCQLQMDPKQPLNTFVTQSTFLDSDGCPAAGGCAVAGGFITPTGPNNELTLTSYEGGATLQWQSSLDNANWTDIPGETTDVYTAGPVGVPTFFRVQVTFGCTVSS